MVRLKKSIMADLSKGENKVLTYVVVADDVFISHNPIKGMYYLYRVIDKDIIKTNYKSTNPLDLERHLKE